MNKSEIFNLAHEKARKIAAAVGDYVIAFSLSLKEVYAEMKKAPKNIVSEIEALGFASINQWRDRYYINLRGNGGNYRGERSAKIWFKEGGQLNVEMGKGVCSSEWHEQLEKIESIFA